VSRILYAWELGGGYGHVGSFLPLALALRDRGHEVVCAVRDLRSAQAFLGRHGIEAHQAPIWLHAPPSLPSPVNYSEMLFEVGYLDSRSLMGMVRGWQSLLTLVDPDLLLVDHAPTCLLAARAGVRARRATFGTGFYSPPRQDPLPSFVPWQNPPTERLIESDRRVVDVANRVLDCIGGTLLSRVADLFDVDEDFLCTLPELDHYGKRDDARYWGSMFAAHEGVPPGWPEGRGAKILCYLSTAYRDFDRLVTALAELPHRVLLYVPGYTPPPRARHASLVFSPQPLAMAPAIAECDLVLCHGGHGTASLALLGGRPLLLLPIYVEQLVVSRNVATLGAGRLVRMDSRNPPYARLVTETLRDPACVESAREFASEHQSFDGASQLDPLVRRCEELVAGPPD
jgi:hypothetical protein